MATLIKRGSIWYSDLRMGGKRIRRALDSEKRLAEVKLLHLLEERNAGRFGRVARDAGYQDFKRQYLAWAEGAKSRYTLNTERRALRYLEDFRAVGRLEDITPHLLEDLRVHLKKEGKAAPGINRDVRALKTIMRWAEARRLREKTDWSAVGKYREPRGRVDFYTPQEFARLLGHCRRPGGATAGRGLLAGLGRRGPAAGPAGHPA